MFLPIFASGWSVSLSFEKQFVVLHIPTGPLSFQTYHPGMAAPNASSEGHHVILSPYRFDANELRWLPTGEAAAKVRMSKEARDGPGWQELLKCKDTNSFPPKGPEWTRLHLVRHLRFEDTYMGMGQNPGT